MKDIQSQGFYVFGGLTAVLIVLKFAAVVDWFWWRVCLALIIFLGFNLFYIIVGFIYLTVAPVEEQSPDEDSRLLENDATISYYWIALGFFVIFADNGIRWLENTEVTHWFGLFSGEPIVLGLFGGLSVVNLFLYWSCIGKRLKELQEGE